MAIVVVKDREDIRCKRCERNINLEKCPITHVTYIQPCICEQDRYKNEYDNGFREGMNTAKEKMEGYLEDTLEEAIKKLEDI